MSINIIHVNAQGLGRLMTSLDLVSDIGMVSDFVVKGDKWVITYIR